MPLSLSLSLLYILDRSGLYAYLYVINSLTLSLSQLSCKNNHAYESSHMVLSTSLENDGLDHTGRAQLQ
jgi:hypothetical protein